MKLSKKIFSLCLAALMLFSLSVTAFAADGVTQICPVIYVPGINTSTIYTDVNDLSTAARLPDEDTFLAVMKNDIIPAIIAYTQNSDYDALAEVISSRFTPLFEDWFMENTGDPKEGSGVHNPLPSRVTAKSTLTFQYDWRCDPVAVADKLNDYINHITDKSGCDKVALSCHSLGSIIIISYLAKYGNDKVSALVLDTPACEGATYTGCLLSGDSTLNASAITYFLENTLGKSETNDLMASILELFNVAGVPELFTLFFDKIIGDIAPVIYKEFLIPLLGCWPSIWALTPDAYIDGAMTYIFDDLMKDEDYSALREKIENYNKTVRARRDQLLKDFDSEKNLAVISRYGFPSFPISDMGDLIGDYTIETRSSSLGATTAPVGTYFDDKYLVGKNMKYISPDRTVDASTCLFPEKTWFIKNATHSMEAADPYYNYFLFAEEELTCDTAIIGRFTLYDSESQTLTEDTTEPVKAEKESPIDSLVTFIKNLIERIGNFFKALFRK